MHIALIGATGFIGSALLKEALSRQHRVTAIVRQPRALTAGDSLRPIACDVADTAALAAALTGHEAVISAFSGHRAADVYQDYLRGIRSIIAATREARVARLLVVGGAGSLEVAPGLQLVDTPDFPEQWQASALGARAALALLRAETDLDWTLLSPAAQIAPGQRTGRFRLGRDQLLVDAQGSSSISLEDYALAMIDELERPAHHRCRFTVGY